MLARIRLAYGVGSRRLIQNISPFNALEVSSCAGRSRRARIETFHRQSSAHPPWVAPGVRAGRGLKPHPATYLNQSRWLRPAFAPGED